jgi:hypothetical protein
VAGLQGDFRTRGRTLVSRSYSQRGHVAGNPQVASRVSIKKTVRFFHMLKKVAKSWKGCALDKVRTPGRAGGSGTASGASPDPGGIVWKDPRVMPT